MNDAEYERQKERLRALGEKWVRPLGLGWGQVDLAYCRTRDEFEPGDTDNPDGVLPAAKCHTDWRYGHSTITWVLPEIADMDDEKLELVFLHELMHIFVNEMRWYERDGHGLDHEERVCTTLAKAFLWLRDSLIDANATPPIHKET